MANNDLVRAIMHDYDENLSRPLKERILLDDESLAQLQRIGLQEETRRKREAALAESNRKRKDAAREKIVNSKAEAEARKSADDGGDAAPARKTTRKRKSTK